MKILFGQNFDKPRYKPLGDTSYKYKTIPKLSDEQVSAANLTKKLPENYYALTRESINYNYRGSKTYLPNIDIIAGIPKALRADKPKATTALPDGYALENYKDKTYLKLNDIAVDVEVKKNKKQRIIAGVISAISLSAMAIYAVNHKKVDSHLKTLFKLNKK